MLVILPCSRGPTERSLLEGKACSSYCLVVMWPTERNCYRARRAHAL